MLRGLILNLMLLLTNSSNHIPSPREMYDSLLSTFPGEEKEIQEIMSIYGAALRSYEEENVTSPYT